MSSLFNSAFIKEQLKRFWPIAALSFVAYLFSCILPLMPLRYSETAGASFMIMIIEMQNFGLIFSSVVIPLVIVAALYSFMYATNSATAMLALPLKKRTIFASNFLAGFILIALPLLLLSILLVLNPMPYIDYSVLNDGTRIESAYDPNVFFPNGLQPQEIINTVSAVFFFFIRTSITFMFYFCLFIFASALCGNQIFYMILSSALSFVPIGLYGLYILLSYIFTFGFYSELSMFTQILFYSTPFLAPLADDYGMSLFGSYVYYAIMAAVLLSLAEYFFRRRRQERAGEGLVFLPFKNLFIFLASVAVMPLGGSFFLNITYSVLFMYLGAFISFLLAQIILRMMTEKVFNIFGDLRPFIKQGIALVISLAAAIIVIQLDIGGYSKYVPPQDEVNGVYLANPYRTGEDMQKVLITDADIVRQTIDVHKNIIENKDEVYTLFSGNLGTMFGRTPHSSSYITYQLKSGELVKRYYNLTEGLAEESGLDALRNEDEVILADFYFLDEPETILSVGITMRLMDNGDPKYQAMVDDMKANGTYAIYEKYSIENVETGVIRNQEEIAALLSAIKKDYTKEYRNDEMDRGIYYINFDFEMDSGDKNDPDYRQEYNSISLSVGENVLPLLGGFN